MKKIKVGYLPLYIKLYDDSDSHMRDPMVAYMNTLVGMLEGNGLVDGISIRKGDHFIIPANYGEVRIEGELVIIASTAN